MLSYWNSQFTTVFGILCPLIPGRQRNQSPLKPQPSLTSGSVTKIPIFVTETQESSVTPIKYIQDISSFISYSHPIPHFEFDFCRASCSRNQLMPVSIIQGIYWSMDRARQRRFSVAQIPENVAKCKITFWV